MAEERERALWLLARALHERMEQLEPTDDHDWDGLTDFQRQFFVACVEHVLLEVETVLTAIGRSPQ